jgi:cytidine diphosphoramidate kinase
MKKKNKNKGFLIWITGLSGSGKTSLANAIKPSIQKNYGKTLVINGDDLRKFFNLNKYDKISRLTYGKQYSKFLKFITDQNINVIFAVVGLFEELRKWNKKHINNYFEIFVKAKVSKIKKNKRKKIYIKKSSNNIVGIQIKPEYPKQPNIVLINDFKKNIKQLSEDLIKKIIK